MASLYSIFLYVVLSTVDIPIVIFRYISIVKEKLVFIFQHEMKLSDWISSKELFYYFFNGYLFFDPLAGIKIVTIYVK